jgi:hypothetical protein
MSLTQNAPQRSPPATPLGTVALVAALLRAYAAGHRPVPPLVAETMARHLDQAGLEIGRALLRTTRKGANDDRAL